MERIVYEYEVKTWLRFNIDLDEIVIQNNEESGEDIFSVERAIENGLDIWNYFDDESYNNIKVDRLEETGNVYQSNINDDNLVELLNSKYIMDDVELMGKIMDVIKQHQKNKNN